MSQLYSKAPSNGLVAKTMSEWMPTHGGRYLLRPERVDQSEQTGLFVCVWGGLKYIGVVREAEQRAATQK